MSFQSQNRASKWIDPSPFHYSYPLHPFSISKPLVKRSTSFESQYSLQIHSSLTIDRFSQSWRPRTIERPIPLSSIDPKSWKKEREKKTDCKNTVFHPVVYVHRFIIVSAKRKIPVHLPGGARMEGKRSRKRLCCIADGVKMHPGMGVSAGDRRENTVMQARNGVCDKIENYISDLGQW